METGRVGQDAVQGQLFACRFSEDELVSVSKSRLSEISFGQRESLLLAPCTAKSRQDIRQRYITAARDAIYAKLIFTYSRSFLSSPRVQREPTEWSHVWDAFMYQYIMNIVNFYDIPFRKYPVLSWVETHVI